MVPPYSLFLGLVAAQQPALPYVGQDGGDLRLQSAPNGTIYGNDLDLVSP